MIFKVRFKSGEEFEEYMKEEMEISANPDLVFRYVGVEPHESYCMQNEPGNPTPEDTVLFFGFIPGKENDCYQEFYSWKELYENAVFRNGVKLKDAALRGEVVIA